jgi:hypothetical protein
MNQVKANHEDDSSQGEAGDWVREREDEQPVELWDEVRGEMAKPPTARRSARAEAEAMVAAALRRVVKTASNDEPGAKTAEI